MKNKQIKDMAGYIKLATKLKRPQSEITATLYHDIFGIVKDDPCFLPRTHDKAEYL